MNKLVKGALVLVGIELWAWSMYKAYTLGVNSEKHYLRMEEHYDVSYNPDRDGEC